MSFTCRNIRISAVLDVHLEFSFYSQCNGLRSLESKYCRWKIILRYIYLHFYQVTKEAGLAKEKEYILGELAACTKTKLRCLGCRSGISASCLAWVLGLANACPCSSPQSWRDILRWDNHIFFEEIFFGRYSSKHIFLEKGGWAGPISSSCSRGRGATPKTTKIRTSCESETEQVHKREIARMKVMLCLFLSNRADE